MTRLHLSVHGVVQGVGFRPFVYREATRRGLTGYVRNSRGRVDLEVQGIPESIDAFVDTLRGGPPPIEVRSVEVQQIPEQAEHTFRIVESAPEHGVEPSLPADLALCADCASEIRDPGNRRYRYPFTNCTCCGPRYSLVEALPYDRAATAMRSFELCPECAGEYRDPSNRRYHAEAIACPRCGPALRLLDASGNSLATGNAALARAISALRQGKIVALKGLGGFQLLVRAADAEAVQELRRRKHREEKPFAVMFPDLDAVREHAELNDAEADLLRSPESPILLVSRLAARADGQRHRRGVAALAENVAAGNPRIGAMLPSTPLHALLLHDLGEAVVCTSGNRSAEPLCVDTSEALARLSGIADLFLSHNRPIVRPMDDSVAQVGHAGVSLLRRARGYAPKSIGTMASRRCILALGAHQKSTVALTKNGHLVMSQHIGDLGTLEAQRLFERTTEDLLSFFSAAPDAIAIDLHPDYASSLLGEHLAQRIGARLVRIQHHAAHVASVCAEHGLAGRVLGFAWDGAGLGTDGTIWGGESLVLDGSRVERLAHLRPFPLAGGDRASREPRRSAAGLLWLTARDEYEKLGSAWFTPNELGIFDRAFSRGVNTPACSSLGRLFDAVAALLGLRTACSFEGQAAMELEFLAESEGADAGTYPLPLSADPPFVADTGVLIRAILGDLERGTPASRVARRFHAALVEHAVEVARRVDLERIVLSGGCFQNALLSGMLRTRLEACGFRVFAGRQVPCNDAGISAGQATLAARLVEAFDESTLGAPCA